MSKGELAKQFFQSGYNCSQSVVLAFTEEMGIPAPLLLRMTAGFGGGIGRLREVCGAVSGMAFVLSALDGEFDVADSARKKELYQAIQMVSEAFSKENGSIVCRELLGLPAGKDAPTPSSRTDAYYKKRPCGEIVAMAADILEQQLLSKQPK